MFKNTSFIPSPTEQDSQESRSELTKYIHEITNKLIIVYVSLSVIVIGVLAALIKL